MIIIFLASVVNVIFSAADRTEIVSVNLQATITFVITVCIIVPCRWDVGIVAFKMHTVFNPIHVITSHTIVDALHSAVYTIYGHSLLIHNVTSALGTVSGYILLILTRTAIKTESTIIAHCLGYAIAGVTEHISILTSKAFYESVSRYGMLYCKHKLTIGAYVMRLFYLTEALARRIKRLKGMGAIVMHVLTKIANVIVYSVFGIYSVNNSATLIAGEMLVAVICLALRLDRLHRVRMLACTVTDTRATLKTISAIEAVVVRREPSATSVAIIIRRGARTTTEATSARPTTVIKRMSCVTAITPIATRTTTVAGITVIAEFVILAIYVADLTHSFFVSTFAARAQATSTVTANLVLRDTVATRWAIGKVAVASTAIATSTAIQTVIVVSAEISSANLTFEITDTTAVAEAADVTELVRGFRERTVRTNLKTETAVCAVAAIIAESIPVYVI